MHNRTFGFGDSIRSPSKSGCHESEPTHGVSSGGYTLMVETPRCVNESKQLLAYLDTILKVQGSLFCELSHQPGEYLVSNCGKTWRQRVKSHH